MIIYWDKKTNSKNRIGQRVKELRKAHNLTQKTLAAKLQLAGYDFNDLAILRISSRSDGRSCKIIQLYCCPFYAKLWIDTSEQHTLFINRMIGAVSYTHLDVYKRQVYSYPAFTGTVTLIYCPLGISYSVLFCKSQSSNSKD